MRRIAPLCIASIIAAAALTSCADGGAEVTREMVAEANADIDEGKMPDYRRWSMEKTESGVRFIELKKGEGSRPEHGGQARVHYTLWLTNGKLIDSSLRGGDGAPFEFEVGAGRVIEGWDEIVPLMNVGSRFLVEIPPKLAYGDQAVGPIPKNSQLVFSIDLVEIR